jgi:hypothetical protein
MLVWPPSGLLFLLLAVDGMWVIGSRRRIASALSLSVPAGIVVCGALLAFTPQFAGWKLATGRILGATYANVGDYFDWAHPQVVAFLFSGPRHGAVTWHPVFALGAAGLLLAGDRRERVGLGLLVAVDIAVLACWSIWWTGIGFGNRFLLNLSPVFVLGLALLIDRAGRGRAGRVLTLGLVGLIFWNLSLLSAYRLDRIRMGIKAPSYVQDPAPSFADVARLLLVNHPFDPRQLLEPFQFNRNLIGGMIVQAARQGRPGEVVLLVGVLAALGGAVFGLTRRLTRRPRKGAALPMAVGLLGTSLVADLFLLGCCRSGPERVERVHIDCAWRSIEAGEIVELIPPPVSRGSTREIHLVSFLSYASKIRQDTVVARLRALGTHGESREFPLRAGRETAECSWTRSQLGGVMRHGIDRADPVRTWNDDRVFGSWYSLHSFRARLDLADRPFEVASIEIEYLQPIGLLYVTDIFLR